MPFNRKPDQRYAIVGQGRVLHRVSEKWPYTRCGKVISYTVKGQGLADSCLSCEMLERRIAPAQEKK